LTLVTFLNADFGSIGPGPWVTLAGGVLVWLAGRGLFDAPLDAAPEEWPRRSALVDVALVVVVELLAFALFLVGIAVDDPGEFLGFFVALTAAGATLASLGVFKGLAGPFYRLEAVAIGLLAVLLLLFPFTQAGNTFWIQVTAQAGLFVLAALGLNIVVGSAGLLDLGYVAFFGIGAYTAALTGNALLTNVNFHVPFLLVVFIVAPVVAAIFGVLLGAPTLRLRGDYLAIVTLGFGEIVPNFFLNAVPLTGGTRGINPIAKPESIGPLSFGQTDQRNWYWLILFVGLVSIFMILRMYDSRLGRSWQAIREDELAASSMGIDLTRTKLWAFALGASFSGFAGALWSSAFQYVHPSQFEFTLSILVLSAVILGGIGNVYGAVLGAFLIGSFDRILADRLTEPLNAFGARIGNEFLATHNVGTDRYLVFGAALVLMMLLRPGGLFPSKQRAAEMAPETEDVSVQEQQDLFDVRAHDDATAGERGGQVA
ncbi:MAG TPA: branched-chain amino acid ABC transporter permease, partial [Thermomicrobiales bacterium]|nr:branched-chain amino acid ABC transporter permease [Thermomicrobiales bacterium]